MAEKSGRQKTPSRFIEEKIREAWDRGNVVVLWRDPVNLPNYVRFALRLVFGWPAPEIERHLTGMLRDGKTVLAHDTRERAEHYLSELQGFGLVATIERVT